MSHKVFSLILICIGICGLFSLVWLNFQPATREQPQVSKVLGVEDDDVLNEDDIQDADLVQRLLPYDLYLAGNVSSQDIFLLKGVVTSVEKRDSEQVIGYRIETAEKEVFFVNVEETYQLIIPLTVGDTFYGVVSEYRLEAEFGGIPSFDLKYVPTGG